MNITQIVPTSNKNTKPTRFPAKNFNLITHAKNRNALGECEKSELKAIQILTTQDSFELLPRFKLITLPEDELGEYELELLSKANKWHIPYDKHNPDFSTLEDDVCSYESLIKQTSGLDINWDYNFYDPVGLEQAISDAEEREGGYSRDEYWDYCAAKGVL